MDERAKLRNMVMEAIQVQCAVSRPLRGTRLATADSRAIKGYLASAGVDVPQDAMAEILGVGV